MTLKRWRPFMSDIPKRQPSGTGLTVCPGLSNSREQENSRIKTLGEDPWVDHTALNNKAPIKNGTTYKFLILGAGYGGLLCAVRLIQEGVATADDIRFLDAAGGFRRDLVLESVIRDFVATLRVTRICLC